MPDCILIAVLACCAVTDVRNHRISNVCLGFGVCLGLACGAAGSVHGAAETVDAVMWGWTAAGFLGRMVLMWVIGFPFFVMGMTGAGDIKIMGLITAFLGFRDGFAAITAGLCLGAVLALGKMVSEHSICQRFYYLSAYVRRVIQCREIEKYYCQQRDGDKCVIPLGACFFAGTLLTVLWKG